MTTIVGLGLITAIFMAVMSMFYLQQIPTQADLDRLEIDIRREHGLYLSSVSPIDVMLVRPAEEGERSRLEIQVQMRPDLLKMPQTIDLYLNRIASGVLQHPDWRGKIRRVKVSEFRRSGRTVERAALDVEPAPVEASPGPGGDAERPSAAPARKRPAKPAAKPAK